MINKRIRDYFIQFSTSSSNHYS